VPALFLHKNKIHEYYRYVVQDGKAMRWIAISRTNQSDGVHARNAKTDFRRGRIFTRTCVIFNLHYSLGNGSSCLKWLADT
jgi:hypothetical protein